MADFDERIPAEFHDIAQELSLIGEAAREFRDRDPQWRVDSSAGEEVADQGRFADAWSATPVEHVLLMATSALMMGFDHLKAMASAITTERVAFATLTLTRPILSASGITCYLLDPTIDGKERLRRGWNMQLASDNEVLAFVKAADEGRASGVIAGMKVIKASAERKLDVRVQAPKFDPKNLHGSRWHIGQKAPGDMELVGHAFPEMERLGKSLYRVASASAHAQPHAVKLALLGTPSEKRPGVVDVLIGNDLPHLAMYCTGAVLALHEAMARAHTLFGQLDTRWTGTVFPALQRWQGLAAISKEPTQQSIAQELGLWLPAHMLGR